MNQYNLKKINPCEKTYCFSLTSDTCYALKVGGQCSLYLSKKEAELIHQHENPSSGSSVMRCRNLAASLLKDNYFNDPKAQENHHKIIMIKRECGHYVFANGQHRTCIAKHLNISSMYLWMYDKTDTVKCPFCLEKRDSYYSILDKFKMTLFKNKTKKSWQIGAVLDTLYMPSNKPHDQ